MSEQREVNTGVVHEEEVLNLDVSEIEGDDEVVVPAQQEEDETPETPAPVSSPEEAPEAPEQPKPVEGETPREKALRLEVQRVKKEKRDLERQSLLGGVKQPQKLSEDAYAKLREKYSDEEIKNSEELVDTIARQKGYVRKDEAYQDTANQVLDGFLDANPEYKPEKDIDDTRWNSFKRILASDYNLIGKTASQLLSIYKKVDRDVRAEMGEPAVKQDARKIETQKQKIQSVSHSGGSKQSGKKESDIDPSVRQHFKGFEDDDF